MSPQLSPRQSEIVVLLADGLPPRTIAKRLGLTTSTVKNHLHVAGLKLGILEKVQVGLVSWHYRRRIADLEAQLAYAKTFAK
jgi:DNA-binding NarL/FixJ family response regulator